MYPKIIKSVTFKTMINEFNKFFKNMKWRFHFIGTKVLNQIYVDQI